MTHRVFVYGSLMRGLPNHWQLAAAQYLGADITTGKFEMINLRDFPGIIPANIAGRGTPIIGEVYVVDDTTLEALDLLEAHPHCYRRERITVDTFGEVWAYVWPRLSSRSKRVPSGDWRAAIS